MYCVCTCTVVLLHVCVMYTEKHRKHASSSRKSTQKPPHKSSKKDQKSSKTVKKKEKDKVKSKKPEIHKNFTMRGTLLKIMIISIILTFICYMYV